MSELRRSLGVADAVVIGAGSMLGAGVFAVWGPAADAAGTWLLLGLAIAAHDAVLPTTKPQPATCPQKVESSSRA